MPEQAIDYERNRDFWDEVTRAPSNGRGLDQVAGLNAIVPERVHARGRARQVDFVEQRILRELPRDADVLDLGCGPGTWALHFAPRVRSVLGIDIAPTFVEHAAAETCRRGITNAEFRLGSFMEFATERKFRLILLGAVLGYVGDRDLVPFLRRVRGWLAPGGLVYVRTAVSSRRVWARRGRYQAVYRTRAVNEQAFQDAGFGCEAERDMAYTEASLATVYFSLVKGVSLGLIRGAALDRIDRVLERLRPLSYGMGRRLLDLTPAPMSYHFLLRPALG